MTNIDISSLQINAPGGAWPKGASPPRREEAKRIDGPFLRGPIPWAWLQRTIDLGGPSPLTGLAIWHYWFLNKSKPFAVSNKKLGALVKLSPRSIQRGIALLRDGGLVRVTEKSGCRNTLDIIEDGSGMPYWDGDADE